MGNWRNNIFRELEFFGLDAFLPTYYLRLVGGCVFLITFLFDGLPLNGLPIPEMSHLNIETQQNHF